MWTRTYLFLLLLRLYFALTPSYIHPDENFQGPEVIAGKIFDLPHHQTWEFTSATPIRSLLPLWPVYALPMLLLKGIWTELGSGQVPPRIIYYSLRVLMFTLNFVLEDWAIHELVQSPRRRRLAITLVASSYVTWTYQAHTFSNSIETLAVLWALVMMQRMTDAKQSSSNIASAILGVVLAFGVFNRITFPAFVFFPLLYLTPHFVRRPLSLLSMILAAASTTALGIAVDTYHYVSAARARDVLLNPVIAPLNSLLYNSKTDNLASHGLHPKYQHLIASLPLLLGPAMLLLPTCFTFKAVNYPALSALSGLMLLSFVPHQEARFLLPFVPLSLSSIYLPRSRRLVQCFLACWLIFNIMLGQLMGVYHQGGVCPAQIWLGEQLQGLAQPNQSTYASKWTMTRPELQRVQSNYSNGGSGLDGVRNILWWRTYSPPIYLLGTPSPSIKTIDLKGLPYPELRDVLQTSLSEDQRNCNSALNQTSIILVAPFSSVELDIDTTMSDMPQQQTDPAAPILSSDDKLSPKNNRPLTWQELWRTHRHINLDDLDIDQDGLLRTLSRVWGRRGLVIWKISQACNSDRIVKQQNGVDDGVGDKNLPLLGDW